MSREQQEHRCKMCGAHGPLVKAHILPESLYRHSIAATDGLRIYSRDPVAYPKRSPIGVYDQTILCECCEKLFDKCDDYAHRVLTSRPIELPGPIIALRGFDYPLLKRFFLAVLWRASVSTQEMFSRVDVGSTHERRLREMICRNDPGDADDYAVWLTVFDDPEAQRVVLQPTAQKALGEGSYINAYRFVIAAYTMWIKVDQRPTPDPWKQAILRPGADVPVMVRNWRTSRERKDVLRVAATARGP
jgi:hypothetical protein